MNITKQQVLENLEQVKQYITEIETKKEEKVIGLAIKNRWTGEIIFQSTKNTYKGAIAEKGGAGLRGTNLSGADLSDADLRDANLRGANLRGAELYKAIFYGKGGQKELTKAQLPDFLAALGFKIID